MPRYKITIEYDGTPFAGWQWQDNAPSVQRALTEAIEAFSGEKATVQGAGRTDAGVHALGQVASVRLTCAHDPAILVRGLNAQLPDDIRILTVEDKDERFHARFSARSKTYRYQIRNAPIASPFERAYVWHLAEPLALEAMSRAAERLVGTHDFAAFRSVGNDVPTTVRTMTRAEWVRRDDGVLAFEIQGDGFLRHMVRAVAGTLVEIGRGWRPVGSMAALLAGGSRAEAGATAPPQGLFLVQVDYD
jgi:tRNA pseudouridine38-40 synthase